MSETTTERSSRRDDVLSRLDSNVPSRFLWSLTLLATLGGFLFGLDTSNIGSALQLLPYKTGDFAQGYLVAGASLGAAAGALAAGPLTDRFGRKALLIIDALIYAIGAILAAVTPDIGVLLFARTLVGIAIGADSAIATAYIAEYAPREKRGSLAMLQQWMITVGILIAYLFALVVLKVAPGSATTIDWRLFFAIGAIPALVGLALRFEMPESPRWLLRKNKYEDAQKAFAKLGVEVSVDEIEATARNLEQEDEKQAQEKKKAWTPGVRRALIVVCVFFIFQQITGINVPLYYGPTLLGKYFQSGHSLVDSATAGVAVTSIMTLFNVGATYLAFRWIDKIGRRKLAIGGFAGMAAMALLSALGIGLLTGTPRIVVSMIGLCLFISSFAIGVGGTGWLIQGETFPTVVRGQAAAFAATTDWIANYALIEAFPASQRTFGLGWVMVAFAVLCVLAILFVHRFLPETKGLSVEEITDMYEQQAQEHLSAREARRKEGESHRHRVAHGH